MSDIQKVIELNRLKGEMLDGDISPAQKQHYMDIVRWLEEMNFSNAEESMEAIKSTPYYLGGAESFELDGINMRIRAMEEIGYEKVADIHRERLAKFRSMGRQAYCFSQEWIDDYNRAAEAERVYAERKEVFGSVFTAYCTAVTAEKDEDRKKAAESLGEALSKLGALGVTFEELASQKAYRQLTMMTDKGLENFLAFVRNFQATGAVSGESGRDTEAEAERIGRWAKAHQQELIKVGAEETWHCANCIAVPSDDPGGYDFIAMKEVDE
ncbi:MAG: hypothetical protein ACI4LA_03400 [Emergencia sp.]